ncbi:hypothetical protein GOODEAATRI_004842, partial [Goodea atripinnis]
ACGEEKVNVLSLRNGNTTTDQPAFISDWTVAPDGGVCLPKRKAVCMSGVAMGCQALRTEVFEKCHAYIAVQVFLVKCEEQACDESDVCELISAYARLCRQRGVCVDWRSPHLCPLHCPNSMEYDACRTGCVEDCGNIQALPGDWSVTGRNESSCMETPTEGCFCTGGMVLYHGKCVSPESCGQCVDQQGHTHEYMQSWVPDDNPCLICLCLDQQRINCTVRPCNDIKAPVCGPCEILQEKKESKCCPEYECVCNLVGCDLPDVPRCEDGETVVLKNPGECQPVHECVCKKEECSQQAPPKCPVHRHMSVKKTKCCDFFECTCNCQNSTHTCPIGFITSFFTNDCGCTETLCQPDQVCVVGGVVHPVGSEWEDGCEKCRCTELQDRGTSLHVAQCNPPVCERNCPLVNSTLEDGCYLYTCGVNSRGDLVLETKVTTCPPFNRTEPECRRTAGTLNYIKVDDCQSEQQIELHYCEGNCRSKSMYSLQSAAVEQDCVCCAAVKTEPLSVPVLCANGTRSHHTVQSVTTCDCVSKHCN